MPVPTEITVKTAEVRTGDLIAGSAVTSVDRKVKWVHLHLANGRKVSAQGDVEQTVTRSVETEAEKRQARIAYLTEDIESGIRRSPEVAAAAAAKMAEAVQYRHDSQWQYVGDYAAAVCANEIWQSVAHVAGLHDGDLIKAVNVMAKEYTDNLLDNRYRQSSTSWTSNGMAATMQESVAKWLRSYAVLEAARLAESETEAE